MAGAPWRPGRSQANWYSRDATIRLSIRPIRAALFCAVGLGRENQITFARGEIEQRGLGLRADLERTGQVETARDELGRRHDSAAGAEPSDDRLGPGFWTSLTWLTAKLIRSVSVPPSIHSLPVCQPSTVGGSIRLCPIDDAGLVEAARPGSTSR